jgi:hypothetical protein
MADCCTEKKRDEMRLFVRQKATNFKTMLAPFCETPEQKEILTKYDENDLETLVKQYLAPLYATGTLIVASETIISKLGITDDTIKTKIGRYLECFCECILDAS